MTSAALLPLPDPELPDGPDLVGLASGAAPDRLEPGLAALDLSVLPPLFVHGSCMYEPVLEALLGRDPARVTGALTGWVSRTARPGPHSVLVAAASEARTPGVFLTDLSDAEWVRLDRFVDPVCQLYPVTVTTVLGPVAGLTYAAPLSASAGPWYGEPWDQRDFERILDEIVARAAVSRDEPYGPIPRHGRLHRTAERYVPAARRTR